jgi:polyisoprenoid-binding protein YceI
MTLNTSARTASSWAIDTTRSRLEFAVRHGLMTTVTGRFSRFAVDLDLDVAHPERSSVQARIDPTSIDTGEPQRDALLRSADFFDAQHFPTITFQSRHVDAPGNGHLRIVGDLTMRDVTRAVELAGVVQWQMRDPNGCPRIAVTAQTTIDRRDFGLTWNRGFEAGWILIGDVVTISITIEAVQRD